MELACFWLTLLFLGGHDHTNTKYNLYLFLNTPYVSICEKPDVWNVKHNKCAKRQLPNRKNLARIEYNGDGETDGILERLTNFLATFTYKDMASKLRKWRVFP